MQHRQPCTVDIAASRYKCFWQRYIDRSHPVISAFFFCRQVNKHAFPMDFGTLVSFPEKLGLEEFFVFWELKVTTHNGCCCAVTDGLARLFKMASSANLFGLAHLYCIQNTLLSTFYKHNPSFRRKLLQITTTNQKLTITQRKAPINF